MLYTHQNNGMKNFPSLNLKINAFAYFAINLFLNSGVNNAFLHCMNKCTLPQKGLNKDF